MISVGDGTVQLCNRPIIDVYGQSFVRAIVTKRNLKTHHILGA